MINILRLPKFNSKISIWNSYPSRGKNPKMGLKWRLIIVITICKSNDVTDRYIKNAKETTDLQSCKKKNKPLLVHG